MMLVSMSIYNNTAIRLKVQQYQKKLNSNAYKLYMNNQIKKYLTHLHFTCKIYKREVNLNPKGHLHGHSLQVYLKMGPNNWVSIKFVGKFNKKDKIEITFTHKHIVSHTL